MSSSSEPHGWRVIVPVRGGPVGKSRLAQIEGRRLTAPERREVALAMARDTVSAAVDCGRGHVDVLTRDDVVASIARACGAADVDDGGRGLNAELAEAARATPPTLGVCVLLADLPALRPEDVAESLDIAESVGEPGILVPDWEETGTTLVALAPGWRSTVSFGFGPGSAARHRRSGLRPAALHLERLRTDVDTPQAWERALRLGLGPSTIALRRRLLGPTA